MFVLTLNHPSESPSEKSDDTYDSRGYREEPLTIEEIRMLNRMTWDKPVAERRRIFMNYKRK